MNRTTAEEAAGPGETPMVRRRRSAFRVLIFFLVAAAAGVVAAQFITSPEERTAATAPPPVTQLTATVEHRVLNNVITARGRVESSGLVEATPAEAYQAEVLTLTRRDVRRGDKVRPGTVPVEVSGRPLIVLEGELPAYRTLRRGDQGEDVLQLQRALRALGHSTAPDPDGSFGRPTGRALRALYAAVGHAPAEEGTRVILPLSEVVYVPSFPARVERVNGRVGAELESPTIAISHGSLTVTAEVRPSDAGLLEVNQNVEIEDEVEGIQQPGRVGTIGRTRTDDDGAATVQVEIKPDERLRNSWNGVDVLLRIEAPATAEAGLVVPVSAVSTRADGTTTLTVVKPDVPPAIVVVDTGASAAGYVAVATDDERVVAGAEVVIGDA